MITGATDRNHTSGSGGQPVGVWWMRSSVLRSQVMVPSGLRTHSPSRRLKTHASSSPPELVGIHANMPGTVPPEIDAVLAAGGQAPSDLSDDERAACDQLSFFYKHAYYAYFMGDRPQSLTGIVDSPVGLAAFMLDHDAASLALISRSFDGVPEGLTPDDVLDNITHFWLTNSGVSAARLYWESKFSFFAVKGVTIPVAVSAYPDELYQAPRSWAEKAYPKLVHYNRLEKGGHFAAWEQPESFIDEVRTGLRSLR